MRSAAEHVMGTVFSLAVPDTTGAGSFRAAAHQAFARLRHVDAVFSPFRPDSAVSLIADGFLSLADLDGLALAEGPRGIDGTRNLLNRPALGSGYQAMMVDPRGSLWTTDGMAALLREPAATAQAGRKG